MDRHLAAREVQKAYIFCTTTGRSQNRQLIRSTVSEHAVLVIAGAIPIYLRAWEKKRIYETRRKIGARQEQMLKRSHDNAGRIKQEVDGRLETSNIMN